MIAGNQFSPKTMTIRDGDSVRASNLDAVTHTFTDFGIFDSGDLGPGQSFTWRFTSPGLYQFECTVHNGMTGSVTVT